MATLAQPQPAQLLAGSDPFCDWQLPAVSFVVCRRADPAWAINDVCYPALHTLVWAAEGRAHYVVGGEAFDVHAGQLLLIPAGVKRSARSDAVRPWRFDSIGFAVAAEPGATPAAARFDVLPWVVTPPADADVSSTVAELDRQWHDHLPGSQLICRGIVARLLGLFVQSASRGDAPRNGRPALERVISLLRSDTRRLYSSAELAHRARLSPSRFRTLFRLATGTSALQFQATIRIRRAAGLLRTGEYTVSEVACLLGYGDIFYFSRQFKQITGLPPSAYLPK